MSAVSLPGNGALLPEVIYLNFFEQELRKIVEPIDPSATYVGRACFLRLGEQNRAKLQFTTRGIRDQYEALRMTVMNLQEGEIDNTQLRFSEIFACRGMGRDFHPSISDYGSSIQWHLYQPTKQDYLALTDAVSAYLEVFHDMTQESSLSMNDSPFM